MTKWEGPDQTRRSFVKTVAYVAPAILTLTATPARAHNGSHPPANEASPEAEKQELWQQLFGGS
jgi:hypothetical protein